MPDVEYKTEITRADLDKCKSDTSDIIEINESYLKALSKDTDHSRPSLLPLIFIILAIIISISFDIIFYLRILWNFLNTVWEQLSAYFHNTFPGI